MIVGQASRLPCFLLHTYGLAAAERTPKYADHTKIQLFFRVFRVFRGLNPFLRRGFGDAEPD